MDFIKANNTCLGIDLSKVELNYIALTRFSHKSRRNSFENLFWIKVTTKVMKSKSKQSRMVKVKIGE